MQLDRCHKKVSGKVLITAMTGRTCVSGNILSQEKFQESFGHSLISSGDDRTRVCTCRRPRVHWWRLQAPRATTSNTTALVRHFRQHYCTATLRHFQHFCQHNCNACTTTANNPHVDDTTASHFCQHYCKYVQLNSQH